jgi:hypothetical protein
MENELLKAIKSLDDRLATVEYILKIIANNTRTQGSVGTQVYFPLQEHTVASAMNPRRAPDR